MGYVITDLNHDEALTMLEKILDEIEAKLKKDRDIERIPYQLKRYPKLTNISLVPPELFYQRNPNVSFDWQQEFTFVGPQELFYGNGQCPHCRLHGFVPDGYVAIYAGLGFMDKLNKRAITRIKNHYRDISQSEINIEESVVYGTPLIVYENPIVLIEKDYFSVGCYFAGFLEEVNGYTKPRLQTVVILGRAYKIL